MDRVEVDGDLEATAQDLVEVGAERLFLVPAVGGDPAVLSHEARQEVGRLVVATGDAGIGLDVKGMFAV